MDSMALSGCRSSCARALITFFWEGSDGNSIVDADSFIPLRVTNKHDRYKPIISRAKIGALPSRCHIRGLVRFRECLDHGKGITLSHEAGFPDVAGTFTSGLSQGNR